jgi:acyl-coenzyme A thioesterase PaaI-like protein
MLERPGIVVDTTALAASVKGDLAASDETGAPPLGHLAGLRRRPTADGSYALELDPDRPALAGGAGVLEFAMLADLALGGAIRNQVGLALPLPTVSMTVQLARGRTRDVVWADAQCTLQGERTATARSQLFDAGGEVVGDAVGVFALPKLPYDGPGRAMPWDFPLDTSVNQPAPESSSTSDVAADGRRDELADVIASHAGGDPAQAWGTAHVASQLAARHDVHDGSGGLVLTPTAPMANRLGHIQGGVLFTTAVLAAAQAGFFPVESLTTATIEFINAAGLTAPLLPEVTVLRAGGRSLFASTVLIQDGRVRCHVSTVFRR